MIGSKSTWQGYPNFGASKLAYAIFIFVFVQQIVATLIKIPNELAVTKEFANPHPHTHAHLSSFACFRFDCWFDGRKQVFNPFGKSSAVAFVQLTANLT